MIEAIRSNCSYVAKIDKVNSDAISQRQVLISVEGDFSNTFQLENVFYKKEELQLIKE